MLYLSPVLVIYTAGFFKPTSIVAKGHMAVYESRRSGCWDIEWVKNSIVMVRRMNTAILNMVNSSHNLNAVRKQSSWEGLEEWLLNKANPEGFLSIRMSNILLHAKLEQPEPLFLTLHIIGAEDTIDEHDVPIVLTIDMEKKEIHIEHVQTSALPHLTKGKQVRDIAFQIATFFLPKQIVLEDTAQIDCPDSEKYFLLSWYHFLTKKTLTTSWYNEVGLVQMQPSKKKLYAVQKNIQSIHVSDMVVFYRNLLDAMEVPSTSYIVYSMYHGTKPTVELDMETIRKTLMETITYLENYDTKTLRQVLSLGNCEEIANLMRSLPYAHADYDVSLEECIPHAFATTSKQIQTFPNIDDFTRVSEIIGGLRTYAQTGAHRKAHKV
jgi:hypothetical protein